MTGVSPLQNPLKMNKTGKYQCFHCPAEFGLKKPPEINTRKPLIWAISLFIKGYKNPYRLNLDITYRPWNALLQLKKCNKSVHILYRIRRISYCLINVPNRMKIASYCARNVSYEKRSIMYKAYKNRLQSVQET